MPRIHATVSGHEVRYDDPGPELEAFLKRVEAMVEDRAVTEGELIALVYSTENPIMDRSLFPGRGAVTREVFDNPVYQVLTDQLFRKEVQQRGIDVAAIAARFTLTPAEVAERLGIHVSAVTKAIQARRVASWVKGKGRYYLDPAALGPLEEGKRRGPAGHTVLVTADGEPSPYGPGVALGTPSEKRVLIRRGDGNVTTKEAWAPLSFRVGQEDDAVLRVRVIGPAGRDEEPSSKRDPAEGQVTDWKRAVVLHGRGGKLRLFELEPAGEEGEVKLGDLFVRGGFHVTRKVNNAKAAREAWEAFHPSRLQ